MFGHSKKYVLEKHTYLSIAAETSLQHAVYTENTVGLLKGIFIIWLRSNRPETSLD